MIRTKWLAAEISSKNFAIWSMQLKDSLHSDNIWKLQTGETLDQKHVCEYHRGQYPPSEKLWSMQCSSTEKLLVHTKTFWKSSYSSCSSILHVFQINPLKKVCTLKKLPPESFWEKKTKTLATILFSDSLFLRYLLIHVSFIMQSFWWHFVNPYQGFSVIQGHSCLLRLHSSEKFHHCSLDLQ